MLSSTISNYTQIHDIVYKLKMFKKLAKLKYLPNKFEIINEGDHVICSISGKKIGLENLSYWNVDLQEAYFSIKKTQKRKKNRFYFHLLCDHIHWLGFFKIIFSKFLFNLKVIFSISSELDQN